MSKVNVIIVNRNGKDYLGRCLETITNQTYSDFFVTVVDNGSTDGSVQYIKENFPKINLIDLSSNLGFAIGNNVAFASVNCDYVVTLNNDTWVEPNFIEELVKTAEAGEKIASVGCKIVQIQDGSIRYGPVYIDRRLFIYKSPYLLDDPDIREYLRRSTVVANCACAALYRYSSLQKIGFFDDDFFSNFEDHDLGYRLNLAGYTCTYTPDTTVFHIGGASEGSLLKVPPKRIRLIVRNQLYTYFKNYELHNLFRVFPTTLLALGFWMVVLWAQRRTTSKLPLSLLAAYFQGTVDFLKVFPKAFRSRRIVQRFRTTSDADIFRKTSVHNFEFYPRRSSKKI